MNKPIVFFTGGHPPSYKVLPRLWPVGQYMECDGQPFTAIQCSDFAALARFARGENLDRLFSQRASCGFNMLRVWTLMQLARFGIADLNPCPYDQIPAFLRYVASFGLYVEFTAYTSTRDPQHWLRLGEACQGETNVLLELVNENDLPVNHVDTDAFTAIPGVLCCRGSNGSGEWPVIPAWDYMTFHTNDQNEWQRKVGHNAMEIADAYGKPVLSNENTRFPDKDGNVQHAYDAAAASALLNMGSCYHSLHGKSSELWGGVELDAALAWASGARSVSLACQHGAYHHRNDLETSGVLRAYSRTFNGREETVSIHV